MLIPRMFALTARQRHLAASFADRFLMRVQQNPLGFPIPNIFRTNSTGPQIARDTTLITQVRIGMGGGGGGGGGGTDTGTGVWPETSEENSK